MGYGFLIIPASKAPVLQQLPDDRLKFLFAKRPPLKLVVQHLQKMSEGAKRGPQMGRSWWIFFPWMAMKWENAEKASTFGASYFQTNSFGSNTPNMWWAPAAGKRTTTQGRVSCTQLSWHPATSLLGYLELIFSYYLFESIPVWRGTTVHEHQLSIMKSGSSWWNPTAATVQDTPTTKFQGKIDQSSSGHMSH